jgi:hypothetical protein
MDDELLEKYIGRLYRATGEPDEGDQFRAILSDLWALAYEEGRDAGYSSGYSDGEDASYDGSW